MLSRVTFSIKRADKTFDLQISGIGRYDFAIAGRNQKTIVKDCHGSQYDTRETTEACGGRHFL
jgi:hypothetical protein